MSGQELPNPKRFITDHNAEGKAVFSTSIAEELPEQIIGDGHKFFLGYTTSESPVDLSDSRDIESYRKYTANPPGIVIPGGTVVRFVDMLPGTVSPMHRTVSLDYGIVVEGSVILRLDSGETRLMRRGDVAIQRGTMHAWENASKTEWARMMYVLQDSKPVTIGGEQLGEDYGIGMDGVRASGN
ncbi:hypothetical protein G7Z17_g5502 [Cylindrodendrum hubeiense]|uniref:Cupin type-2 domain-containing protein n=1 Tax=Cylindrodendrum hubeiense TaxID=595255 RepID=A0A9P5L912_9HYPO|nr:hypothetical protein G7Z17_g5502 [Cylindrodendrum hubeiense]